ncbi:DinB family protein [Ornithinibacillus salinisoli]|uniref:DinB family protein n=1 Tax=Ornithinibacillus salinisoli TaxID=1848459 RepID=A0ABW4VZ69_9BACI
MRVQTLDLYDYHRWANQHVFDHLKAFSTDVYRKEIQSVFPSIAEVFAHMYLVDNIWFSVMKGDSNEELTEIISRTQKEVEGKSLEQMESMFQQVYEQCQDFLKSQDDLDKIIICEHPQFGRLETPLSQLVQHVVNHGTYHRGNITAMLRQMGHEGVPTDYVFYLYTLS